MIYQYIKSIPNLNFIIVKDVKRDSLFCDQVQQWNEIYQIYKDQKFYYSIIKSEYIDINKIELRDKKEMVSKLFSLKLDKIW